MRILVNDHAGHPFPVQLSRALSRRGHAVLHTYTVELLTPRGALARRKDDPADLIIQGIPLKRPFDRYGLASRFMQEKELGKRLAARVREFKPDVVVSAQTPLVAQEILLSNSHKSGARFVFWLQDLLGIGIRNNLKKKLPVLGGVIGRYFIHLERSLLARSDSVIAITEDFVPIVSVAGVSRENIHVIHNWAPIEEMPCHDKSNSWSLQHGLEQTFCFMYSGTLGMKHNPELLVELARRFAQFKDVRIVAVTEGLGAEFLCIRKSSLGLENLILLPFQPFEKLPLVMATADVLVALLEPDAGVFSVPSKVLTYLCAHRPLLLAVPIENLAARIVEGTDAGIVVSPSDMEAFLSGAERLKSDAGFRQNLADNGLRYALKEFDINIITDRFESILHK